MSSFLPTHFIHKYILDTFLVLLNTKSHLGRGRIKIQSSISNNFENKTMSYFRHFIFCVLILFATGKPVKESKIRGHRVLPNALKFGEIGYPLGSEVSCGSINKMREGDIAYFRNPASMSTSIGRHRRNVHLPNSHRPSHHGPPKKYPPSGIPSHHPYFNSQPYPFPRPRPNQYIKPRICEWRFRAEGSCQLVANFEHYEPGELNCARQYLLLGDEDREIQVCGYAQFPGFFKSFGKSLHIKHLRKPQTWSADFEGYVTCVRNRHAPEVIVYGPSSIEVGHGPSETETSFVAEVSEDGENKGGETTGIVFEDPAEVSEDPEELSPENQGEEVYLCPSAPLEPLDFGGDKEEGELERTDHGWGEDDFGYLLAPSETIVTKSTGQSTSQDQSAEDNYYGYLPPAPVTYESNPTNGQVDHDETSANSYPVTTSDYGYLLEPEQLPSPDPLPTPDTVETGQEGYESGYETPPTGVVEAEAADSEVLNPEAENVDGSQGRPVYQSSSRPIGDEEGGGPTTVVQSKRRPFLLPRAEASTQTYDSSALSTTDTSRPTSEGYKEENENVRYNGSQTTTETKNIGGNVYDTSGQSGNISQGYPPSYGAEPAVKEGRGESGSGLETVAPEISATSG